MSEDSSPANSGSQRKPRRRKRYVINAAFQWRYAVTITLTVFMATATMSSILYTVLHQQARLRAVNPETFTASVAGVVLLAALAFALVTGVGVGLWSILVTHRICGPLALMEQVFEELAAGRFPTMRPLRRRDEFKEMYGTLSRAVECMRRTRERELALLAQAGQLMEAVGDNPTASTDFSAAAAQFEELRTEVAAALNEASEGLSTPDDAREAQRPAERLGAHQLEMP